MSHYVPGHCGQLGPLKRWHEEQIAVAVNEEAAAPASAAGCSPLTAVAARARAACGQWQNQALEGTMNMKHHHYRRKK